MAPRATSTAEHAPQNAMRERDEVIAFHDLCSDRMRELLGALARSPDTPRPFGEVEDALGWPRRRISSMLGGAARLRLGTFAGRRPYHLAGERESASGRWEIWVDARQAAAIAAARDP